MIDELTERISSDLHERDITLYDRIEDAPEQAQDMVMVDVLRFSTTACILFDQGARCLRTYSDLDSARDARRQGDVEVLVGEQNGQRADGFDHDNSPGNLQNHALNGERIGVVTTNGTRGLQQIEADRYYIGSTINARAVGGSLRDGTAIVACGHRGSISPEDRLGALFIALHAIDETPARRVEQRSRKLIRESVGGRALSDHGYANDVEVALQYNRSSTVPASMNGTFIYSSIAEAYSK